MALSVENQTRHIVVGIPLHNDIPSLIFHLRKLADKLELIYKQDFPEGKAYKMTEHERIDEIAIKLTGQYQFLDLNISKNWDFTLAEFEKEIDKSL